MQEDVNKAFEVLKCGGVILYPTDTIWGLGCDATNEEAVQKVFEIKKRADKKSMLILLNNINFIRQYVEEVPEIALDIAELSEKPTTVIYSGAKNLAKNLIARDGSIGIRITKEEFTDKLIQKFKKPIVSTSANISGGNFPADFEEISEEIKNSVDYIVKYNQNKKVSKAPSSIIKVGTKGEIEIIRN
ncbi:MAG: threonylcarbamoyl-AMP synthase [Bacteroidales bacterium]|nr:threonylcarbamoyl-AMP synthase [Bacteroidales bacterium]